MKCLNCRKRNAQSDALLGVLPCKKCQTKGRRPKETIEMVGEDIKGQRKQYRGDILQPWRSGILSKEYLTKYGSSGLDVSKDDIRNARNVWTEDTYYKPE